VNTGSIPALALSVAGVVLCAGCDRQSPTLFESEHLHDLLMRTFADTGFVCEGIVGTRPAGADATSLRISCTDALIYLASIGEGGEVCMEPVLYGDLSWGIRRTVRPAGDDAAVEIAAPSPIDPSFPPSVRCAAVNG
jgi:hypothetical protein